VSCTRCPLSSLYPPDVPLDPWNSPKPRLEASADDEWDSPRLQNVGLETRKGGYDSIYRGDALTGTVHSLDSLAQPVPQSAKTLSMKTTGSGKREDFQRIHLWDNRLTRNQKELSQTTQMFVTNVVQQNVERILEELGLDPWLDEYTPQWEIALSIYCEECANILRKRTKRKVPDNLLCGMSKTDILAHQMTHASKEHRRILMDERKGDLAFDGCWCGWWWWWWLCCCCCCC
jgi:hypothetical protein